MKKQFEDEPEKLIYLFQSPYGPEVKPLSKKTIQDYIKKAKEVLDIKSKIHAHAFRDFINTKRLELGLFDKDRRKMLLNQTVGDVNIDYLKKYKNRVSLRELYDKYNIFKNISLRPIISL